MPQYVERVTDKLAENIHEQWTMGKIEQGWTYAEVNSIVSVLVIICSDVMIE